MKLLSFHLPESKNGGSFQEDLKEKHTECVLKGKESSTSHTLYVSTVSACNSLAKDLCEVKQSLVTMTEKKSKFETKCEAQKKDCRNLERQLKRRSDAIERQKDCKKTLQEELTMKDKEVTSLRKQLVSKDEKMENLKTKVSEIRNEKKNAQELTRYHRQKNRDLQNSQPNDDEGSSSLRTKLREYSDIIVEKDDLLSQLSENVDELEARQTSQPAVVTFDKGRYTDDVRVTCLDLLSRNVGILNVEPIIRSVSNNIF